MIEDRCKALLSRWCERLRSLQVTGTGDRRLDGGLLCPACQIMHGRAQDAMYPFLTMASFTNDEKWIESAEALFDWADYNLYLGNGLYLNDVNLEWSGTTVFTTVQLCDCILHHGDILDAGFRKRISERIMASAQALSVYEELKENNINYLLSNALALYEAWMVTGNDRFRDASGEFLESGGDAFLSNGLIAGEGHPREPLSPRGCSPVDIGYNVEETLVSLARLSVLSGDEKLQEKIGHCILAHLDFLLPDGGWDNSFGTRNFKWSYWGSRTSDGSLEMFLTFADKYPVLKTAASRYLGLLEKCTHSDLLAGGPDYDAMGQSPCIHHTFTHAKSLAAVIDNNLGLVDDGESLLSLPRETLRGIKRFENISTYVASGEKYTATVTGSDWRYCECDHTSGGTLSLLYGNASGPVLAAGMRKYWIVEYNNMQIPRLVKHHECVVPRIEAEIGGSIYSSMNDSFARIGVYDDRIDVDGYLASYDGQRSSSKYSFIYHFRRESLTVEVAADNGTFIVPFIAHPDDDVVISEKMLRRKGVTMTSSAEIIFPYGKERIFNMIPGFAAVRADIMLSGGKAVLEFDFS